MLKVFANSGWRWLWITLLVLLLDRITKYAAFHSLVLYSPVPIFSWLNLTLAYNKGAAFNFLNSASGWQVWLFGSLAIIVSIGILIWLKKISAKQIWMGVALSLIMGGALGNLWDRFLYGYVIDFIDFHVSSWNYPAFNVADSAICIGTIMIIFDALAKKK